jgi:hypothetical protein
MTEGTACLPSNGRWVSGIRRAAVTVALAAVTMLPAHGAHGPGCEEPWRGTNTTRSCGFALRGLPLMLNGNAYTTTGTASITLTASILLPDGERVLATCSGSGPLAASCSTEWSPIQDPVDPFVTTAPLVCRVRGTSTRLDAQGEDGLGRYGCFSWQSD